jgi:hypothetical protein
MSKIPPQLREPFSSLLETAAAFTFRHFLAVLETLEDFFARTENFVQRFLEISRALGELLSHLRNILFEALFYLLSKELLKRSVSKTLSVFGGMVGDYVGDQRPREPFCALVRIFGKKRIQGTAST